MIDGNVTAFIKKKICKSINEIGERVLEWENVKSLTGFLDYLTGESKYSVYNAKIQESTHIFMADYVDLQNITSENSKLVINNEIYDIKLIDDPMFLHKHLEIYLKYTGGQNV